MNYQELLKIRAQKAYERASRAINETEDYLTVNPRGLVRTEKSSGSKRGAIKRFAFTVSNRKTSVQLILKNCSTKPITTKTQLLNTLDYIAREQKYKTENKNDDVLLYDDNHNVITREEYQAKASGWSREEKDGVQLVKHLIFSIPNKTEDHAFKRALQETLEAQFKAKNLDFVYSFHNDTEHAHAHVLVRTHSRDRAFYFHPQAQDFYDIKKAFADKFNAYSNELCVNVKKRIYHSKSENLERKKSKKSTAQIYAIERKRRQIAERELRHKEQFEKYQSAIENKIAVNNAKLEKLQNNTTDRQQQNIDDKLRAMNAFMQRISVVTTSRPVIKDVLNTDKKMLAFKAKDEKTNELFTIKFYSNSNAEIANILNKIREPGKPLSVVGVSKNTDKNTVVAQSIVINQARMNEMRRSQTKHQTKRNEYTR